MRLLLAEDEKALSKALTVLLKHNNYSVDAVYNGQEALEYLEADIYDGVILDIMMPKVDGLTVLKTIREKGNTVPVILLTAKSDLNDKITGLDYGADDYLAKPFATQELLARIRAITRRRDGKMDGVTLSYNGVQLKKLTFELSYQGKSVKLNNKEFQMAEMFIGSPGRVYSVDYFMDRVWGFDSEAEMNVVWVYISYLRKKIKEIGAPLKITANRNVGYYLERADD